MVASRRIRPLAICLVWRETGQGRDLFVMEGFDRVKGSWFYRPLGGGIEFGERGYETVRREFLEERAQDLTDVCVLYAHENPFTYAGQTGHELVMVYEGRFVDKAVYELDALEAREDDGHPFTACWKSLAEFRSGRSSLVPEGLSERL